MHVAHDVALAAGVTARRSPHVDAQAAARRLEARVDRAHRVGDGTRRARRAARDVVGVAAELARDARVARGRSAATRGLHVRARRVRARRARLARGGERVNSCDLPAAAAIAPNTPPSRIVAIAAPTVARTPMTITEASASRRLWPPGRRWSN